MLTATTPSGCTPTSLHPSSFAEGDPLELEPSAGASAPAALARTGAATSSAPH